MKKGHKLDHMKLAKRHISFLTREELDHISTWFLARKTELAILAYMDGKLLKRLSCPVMLPKAKRRFITFRRV